VISWTLLLIAPFSLLSEPICMPNFFTKIPKKLLYVLEAFLYCFVMLLHVKMDKKIYVHLFYIFVYFCVFFWWVSCIIVDLNSCHIMLIGTWLYDFIPSDSMIIHLILARLILFRSCVIFSTLLKLELCDILPLCLVWFLIQLCDILQSCLVWFLIILFSLILDTNFMMCCNFV